MRTLVQNYVSNTSTEPMYLHRSLKEVGCETEIWANPNVSAFDMFDSFRPDVFICHYEYISTDVIKYLSNHKNIKIVPNVTGANEASLSLIEDTFVSNKIDCPLMFTNFHESIFPVKTKRIKLETILPCLDVFLPRVQTPLFKLGTLFISTKRSKLLDKQSSKKDVYHKFCLGNDEEGYFDLNLGIRDLVSLIDKYDECIIVDDIFSSLSQVFYEITFAGNNISIKVEEKFRPALDRMWSIIFHEEEGSKDFKQMIKGQIKREHTCFNRMGKLAQVLGNEELSNRLTAKGESL